MSYFAHMSEFAFGWLCVGLMFVLCVMTFVIFSQKRRGCVHFLRRFLTVLFVEYLVLSFCATVVFREKSSQIEVKYVLFEDYFRHNMALLVDALLNMVIFVPIGFCSSVFLRFPKWLKILLLSISLSSTIELSQYVLLSGCCDTNDVMNNVIGGLIGYWLYLLWREVRKPIIHTLVKNL